MPTLTSRSQMNLRGVHTDLVRVVERAYEISTVPFIVTEGLRTLERQKMLVATGKSRTMSSRHLTGHAVDLAIWEDRNEDKVVGVNELSWAFPEYKKLAAFMKQAAAELKVIIEWGGDWIEFKDGPHFQLPFKEYPA